MPSARITNHLHLHFIVFIWGFTAVLGKLITLEAMPLVWYRMGIATLLISAFLAFRGPRIRVSLKTGILLVLAGLFLALHWITFFKAIKISNVSVTLATMSTGAFFTALLEPLVYRRSVVWYELFFGLLVILGLYLVFRVDLSYRDGILLALLSSLLSALFTLINGRLIHFERPSVISFYELFTGFLILSVFLGFQEDFHPAIFKTSPRDLLLLFILGSVCTAYAYIASVKVMRYLSPNTVMLTVNMEPVYGILLALLVFGEDEQMRPLFYAGALLILATVLANSVLKNRTALKSKRGLF